MPVAVELVEEVHLLGRIHRRPEALVTPGDQQGLADAVGALLVDRERREAMGRAARRLAEERFDIRVWCRRLLALYERVISKGG